MINIIARRSCDALLCQPNNPYMPVQISDRTVVVYHVFVVCKRLFQDIEIEQRHFDKQRLDGTHFEISVIG